MSEYTIREYTTADNDALFEVWVDNHEELLSSGEKRDTFRILFIDSLKFVDGSFQVFVAEYDNEVIGYQSALPMRNNPANMEEHALSSTYVKRDHQGSGIGYQLMKRMFEHLPTSNIKLFFGQAKASNETIIAIGEKLGFKKVGDIPSSAKEPNSDPLVLHVYNVPKN